jgi:ribonucleoside-diphosphate reductase alpha chain
MDWKAFAKDIHLSTRMLDNIIDANKYPLPEIDALAKRIRRIGLGVMGFADALIRLGIKYDSAEGVAFGRKVMEFVDVEGKKESVRLAEERGAFPEWERSIWGPDATCARDEGGGPHPSGDEAPQLQRHHRRPDRDDLDHRRLLVGAGAPLRGRLHA